MSILDYLEDYNPSELSQDEAYDIAEQSAYGTSAIADVPERKGGNAFEEIFDQWSWKFFAIGVRPNRMEVKVLTKDGSVKWICILDEGPSPDRCGCQLLPPHLSKVSLEEIVKYILRCYPDNRYGSKHLNVVDIHEYLRPVCNLESSCSKFSVYDETSDSLIDNIDLSKAVHGSYRAYIAREYGNVALAQGGYVKRKYGIIEKEVIAPNVVFEEIVKLGYSANGDKPCVRMVAGRDGGIVISTMFGKHKELNADFNVLSDYLLSMDGGSLRIVDEDRKVDVDYRIVVSVNDKIVITNLAPSV
ncbi:hypothetical protein D3C85_15850 [compost metagenome]